MNGWNPLKPKLNKECILLAASRTKDGWYWGLCDIDGEEWGDIDDLQAQFYKIVSTIK